MKEERVRRWRCDGERKRRCEVRRWRCDGEEMEGWW